MFDENKFYYLVDSVSIGIARMAKCYDNNEPKDTFEDIYNYTSNNYLALVNFFENTMKIK